ISVALIALTFTLFDPPKAQAQAATGCGTPGIGSMIVTMGPQNTSGTADGGTITINNSTTQTVTVVGFVYGTTGLAGVIHLSTPATFTYQ
ncbi:MAG TPA: hypothetical protein VGM62_11845, partial [Chthoniobacterales bacterium]